MTPTGALPTLAFRTVAATVIGAATYSCFSAYGHGLQFSQIVGIALFFSMPAALPSAFASGAVFILIKRYDVGPVLFCVAAGIVAVCCTIAFPFYMSALAPATNWHRGLLLPAATSLAAAFLALPARRRMAATDQVPT